MIDLEEMHNEYDAWQNVVAECQRLGIDMNQEKYNRLIKSICVWGERLHALRATQRADQVQAALNSYEAAYTLAKE